MTAVTKDDFEAAALASVAQFPALQAYVNAGDPRVLAQIRAQAAMLAMLSEQVEVAQFEPFIKARDATVLSDCALKGVLPLARPCKVTCSITNGDTASFVLATGRRFMDAKGRIYTVDSGLTISAGATVFVALTQQTTRDVAHTVNAAANFYKIEVTQTEEDVHLCSLAVKKGAQSFSYAPDWFNVAAGDYAYQVETDERRRMYVCLGQAGVLGYGATNGDVFTLTVGECEGRIDDLSPSAKFNLEYIYTTADGKLSTALSTVDDQGSDPPTMAELRTLAQYPAQYDHSAVYLGNFDFLLRRYMTGIRYLAVWNEQIQEGMRGASVQNINTLFVSGLVSGVTSAAFQSQASTLIQRADNSYRIRFLPTVLKPLSMTITAKVAAVHDPATVEAQIRAAMLEKYGDGAVGVSLGLRNAFNKKAIYAHLRENVAALQDETSDIEVVYTIPTTRNKALYSEQFDNAAWVKTNATVTANSRAFIDGAVSMDKLAETSATGNHELTQTIAGGVAVGDKFTISVFSVAAERSTIALLASGEATEARFNLSTGAVSQAATAGSGIEDWGGGIYRCWASFIKTNTSADFKIRLYNGGDSYAGATGSGVHIGGAQIESGLQVSGYMPATSAEAYQAESLPEHFVHVTAGSMSITVTQATYNTGLWNR